MKTTLPLALTIDLGTQSVRVALINSKGEIEAIVKNKYEQCYFSTENGYAEQNADFYYEYIIKSLKTLAGQNKDKLERIIGATISTFRDTSVQLDRDLKPIRPCILWLDQRMAQGKEKISLLHTVLYKISGMWETIRLNKCRTIANWLKENEPSTWSKTYKYVNISTYLTYKLTGNLVDSISNMTGHYPISFKSGKWLKDGALKADVFGIPRRMCFDIKEAGSILGNITDEVADMCGLPKGIKIIASGSDKACETIGLGCLDENKGAISYGTACTIEVSNNKYHEPEKFLPAYKAAIPNLFNMEVQVYRGYWMLTWFAKEFVNELSGTNSSKGPIEQILNSKLGNVPPGSDGLVLQPYWGPGLSRPLAKGAIVGFSDVHTRDHLYRAIIEGIAYALREGLESIEHSQMNKVKEFMISGGGSQSDEICQITADIFGRPVSRVQTNESTSLGAAICVFTAMGIFKNGKEAVENMVHIKQTFSPNEVFAQQYEYLYNNVYLKLYPSLKKVHWNIRSFNVRSKKAYAEKKI